MKKASRDIEKDIKEKINKEKTRLDELLKTEETIESQEYEQLGKLISLYRYLHPEQWRKLTYIDLVVLVLALLGLMVIIGMSIVPVSHVHIRSELELNAFKVESDQTNRLLQPIPITGVKVTGPALIRLPSSKSLVNTEIRLDSSKDVLQVVPSKPGRVLRYRSQIGDGISLKYMNRDILELYSRGRCRSSVTGEGAVMIRQRGQIHMAELTPTSYIEIISLATSASLVDIKNTGENIPLALVLPVDISHFNRKVTVTTDTYPYFVNRSSILAGNISLVNYANRDYKLYELDELILTGAKLKVSRLELSDSQFIARLNGYASQVEIKKGDITTNITPSILEYVMEQHRLFLVWATFFWVLSTLGTVVIWLRNQSFAQSL